MHVTYLLCRWKTCCLYWLFASTEDGEEKKQQHEQTSAGNKFNLNKLIIHRNHMKSSRLYPDGSQSRTAGLVVSTPHWALALVKGAHPPPVPPLPPLQTRAALRPSSVSFSRMHVVDTLDRAKLDPEVLIETEEPAAKWSRRLAEHRAGKLITSAAATAKLVNRCHSSRSDTWRLRNDP